MTDFDESITGEKWEDTNRAMLALAQRLKREFDLEELIDGAANRQNVALTPGALLVLVTPLVEAALAQRYRHSEDLPNNRLDVDREMVRRSVDQVLGEMKASPALADRVPQALTGIDERGRELPMRSSISVVKALAKRFCNIPPFCGE